MIYAIVFLGIVCVGQLWVILATVLDAGKERYERAAESFQERREMHDRLMAVLTDETNPLFASANATSVRALTHMDRPQAEGVVDYMDEAREYELQRSRNGDDEET